MRCPMLAVGKQTAVSKQDTIGLILPLPTYCHMFLVCPTLSYTIEGPYFSTLPTNDANSHMGKPTQ